MGSGRAYGVTSSEISSVFYIIGAVCGAFVIKYCFDMYVQVAIGNPALAAQFMFMIFLTIICMFFMGLAMALPNYLISKHNLNILIDKMNNPDYIGWIRFTRNKKLCFQTVKCGPLGQTKGMANGLKADIINDGTYTVTTPCGNQAIIKSDLLTNNINLENAIGWQLIKKHHGLIGYKAWEQGVADGKLLFQVEEKKDDKVSTEKTE